jgi:hypothetical protein
MHQNNIFLFLKKLFLTLAYNQNDLKIPTNINLKLKNKKKFYFFKIPLKRKNKETLIPDSVNLKTNSLKIIMF